MSGKKNRERKRRRKEAERKKQRRELVSGSTEQGHNLSTIAPKQKPTALASLKAWMSGHVKALILWIAAIGSIVGGYAVLRIDVTIEPDFLLNDREPFSAYFRVQNRGFFPIYDVAFSCKFTGGPFVDADSSGNAGQTPESILEPGMSATKTCSVAGFAFQGPAALRFSASFRPSFWPWRQIKNENFSAVQDARGILHWTHQP